MSCISTHTSDDFGYNHSTPSQLRDKLVQFIIEGQLQFILIYMRRLKVDHNVRAVNSKDRPERMWLVIVQVDVLAAFKGHCG